MLKNLELENNFATYLEIMNKNASPAISGSISYKKMLEAFDRAKAYAAYLRTLTSDGNQLSDEAIQKFRDEALSIFYADLKGSMEKVEQETRASGDNSFFSDAFTIMKDLVEKDISYLKETGDWQEKKTVTIDELAEGMGQNDYDYAQIREKLHAYVNEIQEARRNIHFGSKEFDELTDAVEFAGGMMDKIDQVLSEEARNYFKDTDPNSPKRSNQWQAMYVSHMAAWKKAAVESALKRIRECAAVYADKKYRESDGFPENNKPAKRVMTALKLHHFADDILAENPANLSASYSRPDEAKARAWFEDFKKTLIAQGIDLKNPFALANVCLADELSQYESTYIGDRINGALHPESVTEHDYAYVLEHYYQYARPAFMKKESAASFRGYLMQPDNIYDYISGNIKSLDSMNQDQINHLYRMFRQGRIYLRQIGSEGSYTSFAGKIHFILPDKAGKCLVMNDINEDAASYGVKKNIAREEQADLADAGQGREKQPDLPDAGQGRENIREARDVTEFAMDQLCMEKNIDSDRCASYFHMGIFADAHIKEIQAVTRDYRDQLERRKKEADRELKHAVNLAEIIQEDFRIRAKTAKKALDYFTKQIDRENCYKGLFNLALVNPEWIDSSEKMKEEIAAAEDFFKGKLPTDKKGIPRHEFEDHFIRVQRDLLRMSGYKNLHELMEHAQIRDNYGNEIFKEKPANTYELMNRIYDETNAGSMAVFIDGQKLDFNPGAGLTGPDIKDARENLLSQIAQSLSLNSITDLKALISSEDNQKAARELTESQEFKNATENLQLPSLIKVFLAAERNDSFSPAYYENFRETFSGYRELLKNCTGIRGSSELYRTVEEKLKNYEENSSELGPDERIGMLSDLKTSAQNYINSKTAQNLRNPYTARRYQAMTGLKKELEYQLEAAQAIKSLALAGLIKQPVKKQEPENKKQAPDADKQKAGNLPANGDRQKSGNLPASGDRQKLQKQPMDAKIAAKIKNIINYDKRSLSNKFHPDQYVELRFYEAAFKAGDADLENLGRQVREFCELLDHSMDFLSGKKLSYRQADSFFKAAFNICNDIKQFENASSKEEKQKLQEKLTNDLNKKYKTGLKEFDQALQDKAQKALQKNAKKEKNRNINRNRNNNRNNNRTKDRNIQPAIGPGPN